MRRRGLLGGLLAALPTAALGRFVVDNPTILDNGLVVPGSPLSIVPVQTAAPIILQAAAPIVAAPVHAGARGYVEYYNLSAARESLDVRSYLEPDARIPLPTRAHLTVEMYLDEGVDELLDLLGRTVGGPRLEVHFTPVQPYSPT
jgi:hypothetical protein